MYYRNKDCKRYTLSEKIPNLIQIIFFIISKNTISLIIHFFMKLYSNDQNVGFLKKISHYL